jgi:hypothetical protein
MTASTINQAKSRLESALGGGRRWTSKAGPAATVWETPTWHLLWSDAVASEGEVRRLWEARKGHQAYPVVLLAPTDDASRVRVAGPQDARPVRELPLARVLDLLEASRGQAVREAASFLAREFGRLEEAVVPGLRVKDLLTPHFVRQRLRWPVNEQRLSGAVEGTPYTGNVAWRSLFQGMGYQVEQLPQRGYLLRHDSVPVAVVHPHRDPSRFSRLTNNGELPEGVVLADCGQHGASWGILTAEGRYRLFQRRPPTGSAAGQHVEIDTGELERQDRLYLGLLAPASLKENGWLSDWVGEAKDFGEALRKGLEERLIKDALPNIARGLGEYLESQGADLSDRGQLRQIEEAALTLVFRFMFLLHTEARGCLPIGSAAYRPHSARQLAEDSRLAPSRLGRRSTQRWDRLRTLVRMVRTGDRSAGVPAYNGSLFAADGFPGSALLEQAEITDVYLAPALAAIAYETDKPDAPGLDYAGLQIGHLGAIYEALLTLRLTRAPEDLAYDPKQDVFRPLRAGEQPEVTRAQLYYQAEAGGRKAGGVFYTRHEFVHHLLNHSLLPALDDHLAEIGKVADRNPDEAARRLFDFSVVDPAMGSAHFLTAALDLMADRIELFLAEVGGLPGIARQPEDGDLLRRLILKRCIYGVDLSPMAVEVANVTLWLASFVPGLALSWLGSNLKCGDALIGVADPLVVGASDSPMFTGQAVTEAMTRAAALQRELAENPDRTPDEVKRSEDLSGRPPGSHCRTALRLRPVGSRTVGAGRRPPCAGDQRRSDYRRGRRQDHRNSGHDGRGVAYRRAVPLLPLAAGVPQRLSSAATRVRRGGGQPAVEQGQVRDAQLPGVARPRHPGLALRPGAGRTRGAAVPAKARTAARDRGDQAAARRTAQVLPAGERVHHPGKRRHRPLQAVLRMLRFHRPQTGFCGRRAAKGRLLE